ncbi:DNA-binding XRE family transcriptional regulator [Rhizobium subbaraonis]|uniref:DNA-binding XRE family transcriptional regulator n=1 Tax=Rhizobium subbaraonis TaxID=908946 RepID=A0A285U537_9HYPH|nr:helix-turn-helix transcriptional regulator [Rhizobium subbaraonis]SOC37045.1 DNA-binding XRE family transcriptional regulator [Rhizobium subbaraonis]
MSKATDTDMQIAHRIRAMRLSRNISKQEIGEAIGTAKHTITRIEEGRSTLTAAQLVAVAALFGVLVSVLVGELPASPESGDAAG